MLVNMMIWHIEQFCTSFRWASSVFNDKYCQRKLLHAYIQSGIAEIAGERALKKHNQNVKGKKNVWWNIQKHKPNETKIRIRMKNNNKHWEVG